MSRDTDFVSTAKQSFEYKAIDILSSPGTKRNFSISEERANAIRSQLEEGEAVGPDMLTAPAQVRSTPRIFDNTVGENNGDTIIKKYPVMQNRMDNVTSGAFTPAETTQMRVQADGCMGGYKNNDSAAISRKISKCFVKLDDVLAALFPEYSSDRKYLQALQLLTSIVNVMNVHQCMASVYKEGVWITAAHCVDKAALIEGRYLLINGAMVQITSITDCPQKSNCDIAFLQADTPRTGILPDIKANTADLAWKDNIFVPGIPYQTPLTNSASAETYKHQVIWSPVAKAYCKALDISKNGCLVHSCSTLSGFSGAPIYYYNDASKKVELIAIHSGADPGSNGCVPGESPNYARIATLKGLQP